MIKIKSYILPILIFLFVTAITVIFESVLIPVLKNSARQPIYEEGPSWHLSKQGTPTMGGLAFVLSIALSALLFSVALINANCICEGISILISVLFCLGNSLIGIIDDLTKLKRKKNAGLTPAQKLFFQFIFAVIFLMARRHFLVDETVIDLSFIKLDVGFIYYPMAVIILLGVINCGNLTDGIDGLASSVALTVGAVFLFIGINNTEISILSSVLIGGTLGFLLFNSHPASIFMGDTGSLFLGALVCCLAFSFGNPILIIFIGGVYVIEGVSVILQVAVYKTTKKRIFKMAPIHHHLEKNGLSEGKICTIAVALTLILSAFALLFWEI